MERRGRGNGTGLPTGEDVWQGRREVRAHPYNAEAAPGAWVSEVTPDDAHFIWKIEVTVDGGNPWLEAKLLDNQGPYAWTAFEARVNISTPGRHLLRSWATDSTGTQQPDAHRFGTSWATATTASGPR